MTNATLRLVTFDDGDGPRPGVLRTSTDAGDRVVPLAGAPRGERGLIEVIAAWERWERSARDAAAGAGEPIAAGRARILAPLQYPSAFLLAGSNYGKHAAEMRKREGRSDPGNAEPYLFALPTRHVIVGTGDDVVVPAWAHDIDWEVELAVVIGKRAHDLTPADAMDAVFGYTILNDVTSRRATRRDVGPFKHDWLSGKGIATFCPMGPCVVPKSELAEPFHLRLTVNGETMQDGDTSDLVFGIGELVAYASQRLTLEAGDVVSTGTPGGVGAGRGVFLKDGDEMVASIAGIGELRNRIVAASPRSDA